MDDSVSSSLDDIQNLLTRYGMTTYLILGNIGLFFNINIFLRSNHRRSSTSLYFLAMSICHLLSLNFGIIPFIYALDHDDFVTKSLIMCKLQFYFRHTPYQMMRTFLILACLNRYISTKTQHRWQSFNQYHITIRCILFVVIFWLLICIFIPILLTIKHNICGMNDNISALIYSIYLLIFAGILPPLAMIISSFMIIYNLKAIRNRVHIERPLATNPSLTRKRDRDYIRMLLVETLIYVLTTFPFTLVVFYTTILQLITIDFTYNPFESILIYISRSFLLYLNSALPFWIYISMSKTFRNEFKDLIIHWYLFFKKFNPIISK